jgi:hypothetical protein
VDSEISAECELAENVLKEREDGFIKRISLKTSDKAFPSRVLKQTNIQDERKSMKKDVIKVLSVSNLTQRIYFVVRSVMMTILGAVIALAVFWQLRTINVIEDFALSVSLYVISLIVSRLFESKIINISKNVVARLEGHPKLRDFIVKNM